jgi:hypothetical protein
VNQHVNANTLSYDEILNAGKEEKVNNFLPNRVGKNRPGQDTRGEVWTPALVARRIMQAFKPKHRAICGPKPYPNRDGLARFTADEDENGNRIADDGNRRIGAGEDPLRAAPRAEMPAESDLLQSCRTDDHRLFYRMGTFLMEYEEQKAARTCSRRTCSSGTCSGGVCLRLPAPDAPRVRQERVEAKEFKTEKKAVEEDPTRFAELVDADMLTNSRDRYFANDDILALEAQAWALHGIYIDPDPAVDAVLPVTLHWLKSGKSIPNFARRRRMSRDQFKAERVAFYTRIAQHLNDTGVPVKRLRPGLDYRKRILQGYGEIASYLGRSIDGVIDHIAKGKIAVVEVDGLIIASAPFILHDRKHRSRSGVARSQAPIR